jgi:6-aminohexanoate-oligomer endohydrolase
VPLSRADIWQPPDTAGEPATNNTTISLIVTNERLDYADLQRLATQVHTSMARAIQPFSTYGDGDTLFAASTEQVDRTVDRPIDLDTEASEIMWDAILASVPKQAPFRPATQVSVPEDMLHRYIGMYEFGPYALLRVTEDQGRLMVLSLAHNVFAFGSAKPVALIPDSEAEFYAPGRYPTRIAFQVADGKVTGAVLNPGLWQQAGSRLPAP